MTQWEALVTGMVWGALGRLEGMDHEPLFTVACPSYGSEDALRGEVILRTKDGAELLVTVTETRSKP